MKKISNLEAAKLWAECKVVLVRCKDLKEPWVELSGEYGVDVLRSTCHEFATPENMYLNGKMLNMPDNIGVESDNGVLLHFNSAEDRLAFLSAIHREGLVK